jgi:hypothetical protein
MDKKKLNIIYLFREFLLILSTLYENYSLHLLWNLYALKKDFAFSKGLKKNTFLTKSNFFVLSLM